ncbi:methyl-accepting chemotaxis protein [Methanomicrobium sp. W14]|uniref:methyl-accepting chemotaxis protein n=1 Tax=Methanomicrobium sp. W14 TaxID=2817839 RepID=UPI001AE3FAFA|nr:methyl-accepting chemotaxis protein [Methanomicrobium sp. W14]MBP2133501.1 methyl-accepting chemotaxis protein [Methanomicrobium sp. W14]
MSAELISRILKRALEGDTSVRVDEYEVSPELKDLAGTANAVIEKIETANEAQIYKKRMTAFVKSNPQAIAVLGPDKKRIDLNREYERIWRGSFQELMKKRLYDFNIKITGGDDFYASFETRRNAVTDMEVSWPDNTKTILRLFQMPILNEQGNIDINYYIYQDMTAEKALNSYMHNEVNKIAANIEKISRGDLDLDLNVGQADENTRDAKEMMTIISSNLEKAKSAIQGLVIDTEYLSDAAINGKLGDRIDVKKHNGHFRGVAEGFNRTMDMISSPLRESMRVISRYAENDYNARFSDEIPVNGEFSEFKDSINELGKKLVSTIDDVRKAVDNVTVGTSEASKGSDEVAKATEQVAMTSQKCADLSKAVLSKMEDIQRQISELSASNNEISSTSQEVLKNAESMAVKGNDAQVLGNDASQKMEKVQQITAKSVSEIEGLNDQMKEINKIVKMITDIAGQINLLALNAAIEAARAGEHGRGFAVVAGEVKNLAGDAKKATTHIEKVIGSVQKNSKDTADAIKSASEGVKSAVDSVNATIKALNDIVTDSQNVTSDMGEIAKAIDGQANIANIVVNATDEGAKETEETLREVEELAALAEEASASVEEIGSAIHEVNEMAGTLKKNMGTFKTDRK